MDGRRKRRLYAFPSENIKLLKVMLFLSTCILFKGKLSDSFTNYNYVGNTKVSVSIKNT